VVEATHELITSVRLRKIIDFTFFPYVFSSRADSNCFAAVVAELRRATPFPPHDDPNLTDEAKYANDL
jgi:hypothetical protein